jgi:hypothetical protein
VMHDQAIWQTRHLTDSCSGVQRPIPFAQSLMQAIQCGAHAFSRQRVHVIGFGLVEEFGYVGSRDGVVLEARFEPLQPECCQHQQRRNKRSEQPRHKGEVNTAKVSAGSRIVTGPLQESQSPSVGWHP